MKEEKKTLEMRGKGEAFPFSATVFVCMKCGREVAKLAFAYDGKAVVVKGGEDGKVE